MGQNKFLEDQSVNLPLETPFSSSAVSNQTICEIALETNSWTFNSTSAFLKLPPF